MKGLEGGGGTDEEETYAFDCLSGCLVAHVAVMEGRVNIDGTV